MGASKVVERPSSLRGSVVVGKFEPVVCPRRRGGRGKVELGDAAAGAQRLPVEPAEPRVLGDARVAGGEGGGAVGLVGREQRGGERPRAVGQPLERGRCGEDLVAQRCGGGGGGGEREAELNEQLESKDSANLALQVQLANLKGALRSQEEMTRGLMLKNAHSPGGDNGPLSARGHLLVKHQSQNDEGWGFG